MKLFLASSLDKTISLFGKLFPAGGKKVLFVSNAADLFDDKWWIELDRKAFVRLGYALTEKDLKNLDSDEFAKTLESVDIIHFCGGSVLYLLSLLKQKQFLPILKQAIQTEEVIYTGTSAGSIIVSKDVSLYEFDEEEASLNKNFKDFGGMALVNFLIIPHCNNPEYIESNVQLMEHIPDCQSPVIMLRDNQAVLVHDADIKFVSV